MHRVLGMRAMYVTLCAQYTCNITQEVPTAGCGVRSVGAKDRRNGGSCGGAFELAYASHVKVAALSVRAQGIEV